MKEIKKIKMKGFSIVEVMLAVFLVSAGMVGVLGLLSKTLSNSMDSRDQTIAVLLAQEGVELVQNLRDNNWAQEKKAFGNDGETTFPSGNKNNCRIDYNDTSLECDSKYELKYNGHFYVEGSGEKFQRKIQVEYIGGNYLDADKAEITSTVTWNNNEPDKTNCNTSKKCAFTTVTLTRWGWN